jgi:hypothetical protein
MNWRGWTGSKVWEGMEGGLRFRCAHDGLGHVIVGVSLSRLSDLEWTINVDVPVDAGQLDVIALQCRELLSV